MLNLIIRLQKNPAFRFAASVKMAVLVMLLLAVVVAAGTIFESLYNAQVAGIYVYKTPWFLGLLGLLWINIFCATVSRVPFKRHHTGFVITHIGLLLLLIASAITYLHGIDGQLIVEEGGSSRTVLLSDLALKAIREGSSEVHVFPVGRSLEKAPLRNEEFSAFTGLLIQEYLPAAARKGGTPIAAPGFSLEFGLDSQFFHVSEQLHSAARPELRMGPATLRLVEDAATPGGRMARAEPEKRRARAAPRAERKTPAPRGRGLTLNVLDAKSGASLAALPLSQLRRSGHTVRGVKVEIAREYKAATVSANRVTEGSAPNPALELRISSGGQAAREVTFQKFPAFSLSPDGFFGLRFQLTGEEGGTESPAEAQEPAASAEPAAGGRSGNVIEFHYRKEHLDSVNLQLYKNNEPVMDKPMKPGDTVVTPWMGMKVTFSGLRWVSGAPDSVPDEVVPLEIPKRSPLPPSAVRIAGSWLMEGEAKKLSSGRESFELYYGQNSVELPFEIHLHRFEKVDYPGTETPMSFQSLVSVGGESQRTLIKMNEPLERDGYMLYQSSYQLEPGQKPVSVFSVNKDPGRLLKYLGAVILVAGILIFIVMRSKWYLRRFSGGPSK